MTRAEGSARDRAVSHDKQGGARAGLVRVVRRSLAAGRGPRAREYPEDGGGSMSGATTTRRRSAQSGRRRSPRAGPCLPAWLTTAAPPEAEPAAALRPSYAVPHRAPGRRAGIGGPPRRACAAASSTPLIERLPSLPADRRRTAAERLRPGPARSSARRSGASRRECPRGARARGARSRSSGRAPGPRWGSPERS